ncbi:MAG: alginate lyase family protein, partial [Armatimonadota bacterium]
ALDKANITVDPEVLRRMERVQDFLGAITLPNGNMPSFGDSRDGKPYILPESSEYFKREDIRYILSQGKEGVKPKHASMVFPDGAWAIMRSPYEANGESYEDARQLVLKASDASHGHKDYLSFTMFAFGRPLLIDPGVKSYEREEGARYVQTGYHNTVCIDGENQPVKWGSIDRWESNAGMDFLLASYKGYEGLIHTRSLVFVKPDYWVLKDIVTGSGSHTCDQNWHLPEKAKPVEDAKSKFVHTNFSDGGNLLLAPVADETLKSQARIFFIAKSGGAVAMSHGEVESTGWTYSRSGTLPAVFDLVLYPYKGGQAPKLEVKPVPTGSEDATLLEIKNGRATDYVFVSRKGATSYSSPTIAIDGETAVLRTVNGRPVRVSGSNLTKLTYKGKVIFESASAKEQVDKVLP